MNKLFLALTAFAALAPAALLAQEGTGQIKEIDVAAEQAKMVELQSEYNAKMEELRLEQQSKMEQLRAEQEAKLAEMRAKEQARIQKEQERLAKVRMERNEKIAELRNQLMQLESERSNDLAVVGSSIVGGYPMIPTPAVEIVGVASSSVIESPIMNAAPITAPATVVEMPSMPAPIMSAPVIETPMIDAHAPAIATPVFQASPAMAIPAGPVPSVHMTPVLMQIYGPPVIAPSRGCLSGKCRR